MKYNHSNFISLVSPQLQALSKMHTDLVKSLAISTYVTSKYVDFFFLGGGGGGVGKATSASPAMVMFAITTANSIVETFS